MIGSRLGTRDLGQAGVGAQRRREVRSLGQVDDVEASQVLKPRGGIGRDLAGEQRLERDDAELAIRPVEIAESGRDERP